MSKIQEIEVTKLLWDATLYPRVDISDMNVTRYADCLRAGETFPNIHVEEKTKRIIDGVTRWKAWQKVYGGDSKIPCELHNPKNDAEFFRMAVEFNTAHGLQLNPFERTKCLLRFDELGVSREVALRALRMTVDSAEKMEKAKTAFRTLPGGKKEKIAIKGAMHDFRGETLTGKQQSTNKMSGGMRPAYYIEQLIGLVESGLCAKAESKVLDRLEDLRALLNDKLRKRKSA